MVNYRLAERPGESCRLATTLLGPGRFPAREIAGLYHERWEIETTYDEVRTHLLEPGASLRSKTPELILQKIDGLMLAHCAVRGLIHRVAEKAREDLDGLSFTHAERVIRRRLQNPGAVSSGSGRYRGSRRRRDLRGARRAEARTSQAGRSAQKNELLLSQEKRSGLTANARMEPRNYPSKSLKQQYCAQRGHYWMLIDTGRLSASAARPTCSFSSLDGSGATRPTSCSNVRL